MTATLRDTARDIAVCDAVDDIIRTARKAAREFHQATSKHIGPAFEDWATRTNHHCDDLALDVVEDLHSLGFKW